MTIVEEIKYLHTDGVFKNETNQAIKVTLMNMLLAPVTLTLKLLWFILKGISKIIGFGLWMVFGKQTTFKTPPKDPIEGRFHEDPHINKTLHDYRGRLKHNPQSVPKHMRKLFEK